MQKVVLITGGTSGIGKAIAHELAKHNFTVYAAGRRTMDGLFPENVTFCYLDVTKPETISALVEKLSAGQGKIDILINCAGIGVAAALEEIPINKVEEAFNINFLGTLRTIQAVTPVMRKNNAGLIINISSIGGRISLPFQGVYSSTKYAIEGMSEALSIELKPFGIKVCIIEPGDYNTEVSQHRIVHKPTSDSPYNKRLTHYFDLLNSNIENSPDPVKLAKLVVKIANKKNPGLRYKSGKILETITPAAQKIIPARIFENLLAGFYKL